VRIPEAVKPLPVPCPLRGTLQAVVGARRVYGCMQELDNVSSSEAGETRAAAKFPNLGSVTVTPRACPSPSIFS
jgi:hypothetical protein